MKRLNINNYVYDISLIFIFVYYILMVYDVVSFKLIDIISSVILIFLAMQNIIRKDTKNNYKMKFRFLNWIIIIEDSVFIVGALIMSHILISDFYNYAFSEIVFSIIFILYALSFIRIELNKSR